MSAACNPGEMLCNNYGDVGVPDEGSVLTTVE